MRCCFAAILVAYSSICCIGARDLHVDPVIGDDENDGAVAPLKTIQRAIRVAEPGDTIHLKPVVYFEYAVFHEKKDITLDGHGATLEGSDLIGSETWTEVSPGHFKNDTLMPTLNRAILWRWFFLMDGRINRMGRVLKGKSAPFKKTDELKPGEWTFVPVKEAEKGAPDSDKVPGSFFIKLKAGQMLQQANIRYPKRPAGVIFSGDNSGITIRNLTATHPYNDGFGIHGDCRNCVFENIRAIECGDDGISAHESAQYRVDGFVSIGNGTGICDTGSSETSYDHLFIADCVGVDLYFLHTGRYAVKNAVVLSSAQRPLVVVNECQLSIDNLYIRRVGDPVSVLIDNSAKVYAKGLTLDKLDVRGTGDFFIDAKDQGADLKNLKQTVVPESFRKKL